MSIENIQDFYQSWCSGVKDEDVLCRLNNPTEMAKDLQKVQNEICETQ